MAILEQGPAVVAATVNSKPKADKPKANDVRFADRGGRMAGVHAAKGNRTYASWKFGAHTAGLQVGRGSRLASETLRNGTITPTRPR